MNKKKKDTIIASALVVVFVLSFSKNILFKKKPRVVAEVALSAEAAQSENLQFITQLRKNEAIYKSQDKWEKEWARDPFSPAPIISGEGEVSNLVLKGIFWDETNPKAVINKTVVKKGDTLMGFKIMEIKPRSVIVWTGEKNLELELFRLKIDETGHSN